MTRDVGARVAAARGSRERGSRGMRKALLRGRKSARRCFETWRASAGSSVAPTTHATRSGARVRLAPPTTATLRHQAVAPQELAHATRRRPVDLRLPRLEPRQELPRSPGRVPTPHLEQRLAHRVRHAVRTVQRGATAIDEPFGSLGFEAVKPLGARIAAVTKRFRSSMGDVSLHVTASSFEARTLDRRVTHVPGLYRHRALVGTLDNS
jgi:hypothetical protein